MFQKDVVAPGRMRRKIRRPRILLLDCPLEYKKGENQTNVELTREEDWCAPYPTYPIWAPCPIHPVARPLPQGGASALCVCCGSSGARVGPYMCAGLGR
jgi:hypothetical protein